PHSFVRNLAAAVVLGYALLRLLRMRHPRWVGMRVGSRDLVAWSFVMSSAHGAGLMLVPVLLQCHPGGGHAAGLLHGFVFAGLVSQEPHVADPGFLVAAVVLHTLSLLAVAGEMAIFYYEYVGLQLLNSESINLALV